MEKRPFIDHSKDALEAPATPEENRKRLAREAAGVAASRNTGGDDPDKKRPAGNRAFVRKDEDRGLRKAPKGEAA